MNSPRLRPYHNPENFDESRVPKGWRFRYADEMQNRPGVCGIDFRGEWIFSRSYEGTGSCITYIVPVA